MFKNSDRIQHPKRHKYYFALVESFGDASSFL